MSDEKVIKELQEVGAHFGYTKSRRHPSMSEFVIGRKDLRDIFDLSKTNSALEEARKLLKEYLDKGATVLFVGTKNEARKSVKEVAESLGQPYVNLRFIGGTITNFTEIKKRLARLKELRSKFEAGNLEAYTKKERVILQRELNKLEEKFGGISQMDRVPSLVVLVDPQHESIALKEANDKNIPTIGICNSDINANGVTVCIPANDASYKSIAYILKSITK